ncbi:MAG: hypothetical protein EBU14_15590, partial [Acetobacteraceae bacterium]|nr:hypothetical protein [Acetobacteraceae bacterium]
MRGLRCAWAHRLVAGLKPSTLPDGAGAVLKREMLKGTSMALTQAQKTALEAVTTATLTTVLLKKGVRFCYIAGSNPIVQGDRRRIVGPAFTLRFTPTREDLATVDSWSSPRSTRAA